MSSYDDIIGKRSLQKGLNDDQPDVRPAATAAPQVAATGASGSAANAAAPQAAQNGSAAAGANNNAGLSGGKTIINAVPDSSTIPGYTQPASATQSGAKADEEQSKRRYMTLADIEGELKRQDDIMRQNAPETTEERAAREKKEKRNKMFAALGDGISALSNLFFTTKGAPNMYNSQAGMSEATRRRIEMARAARDKEREAYDAAATRRYAIMQDADSRAYKWDNMARQERQDADNKARKDALAKAQAGKYKAAQDKDEAMTAYYDKKAELLELGFSVDQAEKMARIEKLKAEADKARRQGTSSWVGSSGSGRKGYGTFNGKPYATKADYKKAVTDYALREHIPLTYNRQSSSKDAYGDTRSGTTQTYRPIAEVAADAEAHYKRTHAQQAASKPKQQKSSSKASAQRSANKYTNTRRLGL